jgi:4-alpha-methyl-delta7-sterol-4alpha-methyl oxidase
MLEDLAAIYEDPLFWRFPIATVLLSMVAFLVFAAPLSLVAAKDWAPLRARRIQNRRERSRDVVGPSIRFWLRNNLAMIALVVAAWPLLRRSGIHEGPLPPLYVIGLQVVFFIYLDDFLFYWVHRAMHAPFLYKRVHYVHHQIMAPWAITGHYMHPVEYLVTGALSLVGPLLVSAHVVTLWIWVVFRQWEAAEGHSGYELSWTPTHLLPGNDGALHHDFHHAKVRGNYAGFLRIWDRVFGTYARGYGDDLARRGRA